MQEAIGDSILSGRFLQARKMGDDHSAAIHLYEIADFNEKVCKLVSEDFTELKRYVDSIVATQGRNRSGGKLTLAMAGSIAKRWLLVHSFLPNSDKTLNVAKYGNPYMYPDDWVQFRAKWIPQEGPFPILQEMFSRLKYSEQVAALFWGIYSGEYDGRQCLWLVGPGQEGKSTLVDALGDYLFSTANGYVVTTEHQLKDGGQRFFVNSIENSKLFAIHDCTDADILNGSLMKSISGGVESLSSEGKGTNAKTVVVDTSIMVTSNILPKIVDADYSISRSMVCPMTRKLDEYGNPDEKLDPNVRSKIGAEIPGFLYWAKDCFDRLYEGSAIKMPEEYNSYVQEIINLTDSNRKGTVSSHFVFDPEGIIMLDTFRNVIRNNTELKAPEITAFITWFVKGFQQIAPLKTHEETNIQYFEGIRAKTESEKNIDLEKFKVAVKDKTKKKDKFSRLTADGKPRSTLI